MKKTISLIVASVMLLGSLSGCELPKKEDKNAWIEEASKKVEDTFSAETCTEFYLNGKMYAFPCNISEFLDNGWEFKDPEDGEIEIEPGYQSNSIYILTDEDEHTIKIGVTNTSDETLTTSECDVDSFEMGQASGNAMIAGDIAIHETKFDSIEDLESSIDSENMDYDIIGNKAKTYKSIFENEEGYSITAEIYVMELENTSYIDDVTFSCEYYTPYNFADDINGTIKGIFENDPSYIDADFLIDITPEDYVEYWRGPDGLPLLVSYMMGFDFTEFTDEQLVKLDAIIAKAYEVNSYTAIPVEDDKVIMTYQYYDFFNIVDKAYDALLETDINADEYLTSEECFNFMCDKMIEIYDNHTDYMVFPTATTYDALNEEDTDTWYDILYLQLGMADLLEE
ncbi:MAG: hypothetical protein MJ172_05285 [Clostridia bacterium]|nr:hypothetical protein [Clostridia bacterium]